MPIQLHSAGWRVRPSSASRGTGGRATVDLPGLPPEFLTDESFVADEAVVEPATTRGGEPPAPTVDLDCDVPPGRTALLAVRHPSGALTFHRAVQTTSRGTRGGGRVRFQVPLPAASTRGVFGQALKAIVVSVAKVAADGAVSLLLPRLVERFEKALWKKRGLEEGWVKVTAATLVAGALEHQVPTAASRSLLLIHGTFSNTASAYASIASSAIFDRVRDTYGDRIFGFDHFSLSRTPEDNVRMLLQSLPDRAIPFDVVTHSRGGLVLRTLVERSAAFGPLARRVSIGKVVLVAAPNDGTPLATPKRWDETVGWIANLLELFPDNPFTTGPAFVANALVWMANHASGDVPGLHAMDRDGEPIGTLQAPPGPPDEAYSALVSNYQAPPDVMKRLLDAGLDGFFGSANDLVVPSEGGWRVDRSRRAFIPGSRIGCFGPGGNLTPDSVTHVSFFAQPASIDFVVNALLGRQQPLTPVDPRSTLPDRRAVRGATDAAPVARVARGRSGATRDTEGTPLHVSVLNSDLIFEAEALLVGHYRSSRLTGTEGVMNRVLGGSMAQSLQVGLYPSAVGTFQIFANTRPDADRGRFTPRPKAVIVAGLGDEGKLQAADLVRTVRQAVLGWAQRLAETRGRKARGGSFVLASTVVGSGGTGVGAGAAARLVAQGVAEANALIDDESKGSAGWPRVAQLRLIEIYLDRATEAWNALQMQAAAAPGVFTVAPAVEIGTGALKQPPNRGYRGASYDFVTVETLKGSDGQSMIAFTLDTKRARSEVRGQRTQSDLVRELVITAADDQNRDTQIGRTLFNLLVPPEVEPYLVGTGEMQMQLDAGTAGIPWELLDAGTDPGPDALPWALRVKLLRKLRTDVYRDHVVDADADASVLIIGEPACTREYPRLYGARLEALAVRDCLCGPSGISRELVHALVSDEPTTIGADARTVVNAVFERPWRIVHIAGHGAEPVKGKPGGVVLSNGSVLGPDEIENMRTVPELVFVNCCHLGALDPEQVVKAPTYDRAQFAATVAGALIRIGVRCVIAAGWAVDDEAASVFARVFYDALLQGHRFIDAVADARRAAYQARPDLNTWAAYQCYGDPDWRFQRQAPDPNRKTADRIDYSFVASPPGLLLELDRIVVESTFQRPDPAEQLGRVRALEDLFAEQWGAMGAVAEQFGRAFVAARDLEKGLTRYERALAAGDAGASLKAIEDLASVRARRAWELVDLAQRTGDAPVAAARRRRRAAGAAASTDHASPTIVARANALIESALGVLDRLSALEPTRERLSLLGAIHKRRALIAIATGARATAARAMSQMLEAYRHALTLGTSASDAELYYPASNVLAADVALHGGTPRWRGLDPEMVEAVEKGLQDRGARQADFWTVAGAIELRGYEAIAARKLASTADALIREYQDLQRRVSAPRLWTSIYDSACLVLPSYAPRVTGRERAAADRLLAALRGVATRA